MDENSVLPSGTAVQLTPEQIASFQPADTLSSGAIGQTGLEQSSPLPPGTKVKLSPEQAAAFRKSTGQFDPLQDFTAEQLASLQSQTPEFNPVHEYENRPEFQTDPVVKQKVADALHIAQSTSNFGKQFLGIEPGAGLVENALNVGSKIGGTAIDIAKGFGKQAWNYANMALSAPEGALLSLTGHDELARAMAQNAERKFIETTASSEQGLASSAKLADTTAQFLARKTGLAKPLAEYTPQDKLNALDSELAKNRIFHKIEAGHGPLTTAISSGGGAASRFLGETLNKATGINLPPSTEPSGIVPALEKAGIPVQPEEVQALSAGDPLSWYLMGKVFHGVGGVVPKGVSARAAQAVQGAGEWAAKAGGKTIETAADLVDLGARAAKFVAPAVKVGATVVGAIKGLEHAGPFGLLGGLAVGEKIGEALKSGAQHVGEAAQTVGGIGEQIAGKTPMISPIAQLGKDVLQSAPGAVTDIAKGTGFDLGLAAVTSEESPEKRAGLGIGAAFGALGAGKRVGGRVLSGQIIAPRAYGSPISVPSSGAFPTLDTMHSAAVGELTPGQVTRVNAIRAFLKGAAPNADIFVGKDPASVESALLQSGVNPEQAKMISEQKGFFTTALPDKNGNQRTAIIAMDPDTAPHEAFHAIQDVLGESANQEIDKIVKNAYTPDQFEAIGQDYARRLVGQQTLQNKTWREALIDASGWGKAEAAEKITSQISNQLQGDTGTTPDPETVRTMAGAQWDKLVADSAKRNPQVPLTDIQNQVWRDVLTPEEAQAVGDKYLARELAAENFDAVFKHAGPSLNEPTGLLPKLARIVGNVVTAAGGEPLQGRVSETGQYPLKSSVVEAVKNAVPEANRPVIEPAKQAKQTGPKATVTPGGKGIPTTPEAQQQAAEEARTLAATASDIASPPTAPNLSAPESPKTILQKIADAIASRSGVKLNYLSAPDEPAAATTSSRPVRRAIIEAFRTMPQAARALWEKSFFPERVIQTQKGKYQVLGWAPEVFASNAHKLAQTLVDLPAVQSPYELDTKNRTFSEAGWKELFNDAQTFVRNQIAGTTGAGEPLVVPKGMEEAGFHQPLKLGEGVKLDQRKADFLNTLFNFKLPETPRITGGKLPLNVAGQEVSTATKPGRLSIPIEPKQPFAGESAQKLGIEGRQIAEVNPFRAELEAAAKAAGVPKPDFIEAIQRLSLDNIKEVQQAPELPQFRGNTLTLSAGFQPKENERISEAAVRLPDGTIYTGRWHGEAISKAEDAQGNVDARSETGYMTNQENFISQKEADQIFSKTKESHGFVSTENIVGKPISGQMQPQVGSGKEAMDKLKSLDPKEWEQLGQTYKGKYGGGITGWAVDQGLAAKTPEDLQAFRDAHEYFSALRKDAMSTKDWNLIGSIATKAQAAREAFEAATGRQIDNPNQEAGTQQFIKKYKDPNFKAPLEPVATKELTGQFQPSDNPKAVKEAATRDDETGKIYTGSWHGESTAKYLADKFPKSEDANFGWEQRQPNTTEGFVTNSGEFLDRTGAYERAKELNQVPTSARGALESDEFNATRQFQPNTEPRAIKSAAVQDEAGKLFLGPSHREAYEAAGVKDRYNSKFKEGFVTNEGEFLTRKPAFDRAAEFNQLNTPFPKTGSLNSENINAVKPVFGLMSEDLKIRAQPGTQLPLFPEKFPEDKTKSSEFKKWFGTSKTVDSENKPIIMYHGTPENFNAFDSGIAFFTPDENVANQYRIRKIFENASPELPEDVNSVDELGAAGIEQIAKEDNIDLTTGKVIPVFVKAEKPLDLRELGPNFSPSTDWDYLHEKGLVNESWKSLGKEGRQEIRDNYGNQGLWKFLDDELHNVVEQRGYDSVVFKDMDLNGKSHDTYAVFKPEQVKGVENRGSFDPSDARFQFQPGKQLPPFPGEEKATEEKITPAPVWYSQLQKTVESKIPNNATGEQILATLRNPQNGVKPEELKWSGLEDYLSGKSKISKKDLQDYLRSNELGLKEVPQSEGKHDASWDDVTGDEYKNRRWELSNPDTGERYAIVEQNGPGENWSLYRGNSGRHTGTFTTDSAAMNAGDNYAPKPTGGTKFETYQLPGGSNYQELLFILPESEQKLLGYSWNQRNWKGGAMLSLSAMDKNGNELRGVVGAPDEQRNAAYIFENEGKWDAEPGDNVPKNSSKETQSFDSLTEAKQYAENTWGTKRTAPAANPFNSSHWDEPNVLAHTRFNERTDTNGKPGLFLEEVQSDWHQEGRKKGYGPQPQTWTARDSEGKLIGNDFLTNVDAIAAARDAGEGSTILMNRRIGGVPEAPFKNTWHEMVLRRMIRLAAEQGKDWLGWTTGEQQAERYDLSKHLNAVHYEPNDNQTFDVGAIDKEGESIWRDRAATLQTVEDTLGKEIAQKMIAKTGILNEDGHRYLENLDLKVGGEGMKGFYDKILVDYANKFGKKFGAKVQTISVPGEHDASYNHPFESIEKARGILDAGGEIYGKDKHGHESLITDRKDFDSGEYTSFVMGDKQPSQSVHALEITPAMKKSALTEGMTQFQPIENSKPGTIAPAISPRFVLPPVPAKQDETGGEPIKIEPRQFVK